MGVFSVRTLSSPAPTTISMPMMAIQSGYSPKNSAPKTMAQISWLYCTGATRLAGERLAAAISSRPPVPPSRPMPRKTAICSSEGTTKKGIISSPLTMPE
ncbi:hypothetical protein D3C72_2275610 [compost metagenome]